MSRNRRTAGPLVLFLFLCTFSLPLSAQDADSTRDAAVAAGEELPFAHNARRYRLRVWPEFCIGFGIGVAGPDMSGFDARYHPDSKPSNHIPLGSLGLKLRYQPLSWLAFSLTTEARVGELGLHFDSQDRYNRWLRNAISITAHQGIYNGGLFSLYGGAGITRIDYEHSGYTFDETLHITAREFGAHLVGGAELDMVGGPIFSLSAAYDIMPEVEGVNLSSYLASFHVLFQL